MNVLLIDNYDSFTFNIVNLLRSFRDCSFEVIKSDKVTLEDLLQFDKIIISPGPGKSTEFPAIEKAIHHCIQIQKPLLGICLGHQAICEYFGGQLFRMYKPVHGHKKMININTTSALFHDLAQQIEVGLYHSWAIKTESLPESLQILGTTDEGLLMAVKHKEYNIYGIQFHPESFLTSCGNSIIRNFLNLNYGKGTF